MIQEKEIIEGLRAELKDDIIAESRMLPNKPMILIKKGSLIRAIRILVENFESRFCAITAIDNGLDFELIYHISIKSLTVHLKTIIAKEDSKIDSITSVVPGAATAEREIIDLFKIEFQGLADSRALILPSEWRETKTPLRKAMGGIVTEYQKPTVETLLQQGQVFTMPTNVKTHRQNLKLPDIQTTMTRPEALKEILEIAGEMKFDRRVGYNWEKKKLRY
jgi:Ni,Fe-hydrogenase III component G